MKSFAAGLVVLLVGMGLGAQDAPIALREGSWPERGLITEIRAIHDLRGGIYIPYIAEGSFRILRADAGGKLIPHAARDFDGDSLEARTLKTISDGSERYIAFIGRDKGETIHLFGFGFWDELSYLPLEESGSAAIADFSLVPSINGGVTVYTLAGNKLRIFSTGIRDAAPVFSRDISWPGEKTEAFEVFRNRAQEISYGWYRVERQDHWEINLFSLDAAGNLTVERTGPHFKMPQVEYGSSPEGKAVFTIVSGNSVLVCHAEGPRFLRDLQFEAPFAVKQYSPALLTGGPVGLLFVEGDDTEFLYGVSHEQSGAPALQKIFTRPSAEFLSLFFLEHDRISLIYRSGLAMGAALLRSGGGVITDDPLLLPSGGAVLLKHPLGGEPAYVVSGSGESPSLTSFDFNGETWRPSGETRFPGFFPQELYPSLGFRNRELLLMTTPETLMLYEPESGARQTLEMKGYARSNAHNGVVCLAISSEDGIVLYRIEE
jgi:hypothetical protein